MAAKRYSAGRIFLQVVPSFRNFQREVRAEVNKANRAIADDFEKEAPKGARKAGRTAGEQFMEGVAERTWTEKDQRRLQENFGKALINLDKLNKKAAEKRAAEDAAAWEKRGKQQAQAYAEDLRRDKAAAAERKKIRNRELKDIGRWVAKGTETIRQTQVAERKQAEKDRAADLKAIEKWVAKSTEAIRQGQVEQTRIAKEQSDKRHREDVKSYERAEAAATKAREKRLKEEAKVEERIAAARGGAQRKYLDKAIKSIRDSLGTADLYGPLSNDVERFQRDAIETGRKVGAGLISVRDARRSLETIGADIRRLRVRGLFSLDATERNNLRQAGRDIDEMSKAMSRAADGGGRLRRFFKGANDDSRDGANAFRIFNFRVLGVVSALPLLVPLLAATAGGLVALTGAALGAGAGLGVMLLGFSGIGDAVKGLSDVQSDATKNALANEKATRNSARSIRDAQQGLVRARQSAARSAEDSNRRIADAERRLADAQRDATDAQEDLRDARAAAQRDQDALADRIKAGALDERQALIDLFNAQVAYNAAMADGGATNLEKEQASIDLERAQLAIKQIRDDNRDLRAEQAQAQREGVEGDDRVIAAKERVADAQRDVADAERGVADARRDAAQAAQDNAVAIRDATERLTDAQAAYNETLREQGEVGSAAQQRLEEAMSKLGPEGQRFARYLFSIRGLFYDIRDAAQEGMLPGVQDAMESLIGRYGPSFTEFVRTMGYQIGDFFRLVGDTLQSPVWVSFFQMLEDNAPLFNQLFGETMLNLATFFAGLFTAFEPVSKDFAQALADITADWATWSASLNQSDGFQAFLGYLEQTGPKVWELITQIVLAFVNLGVAMAPIADKLLDLFIAFFEYVAEMDPDLLAGIVTGILGFIIASQLAAGALQLWITFTTPFHGVFSRIIFLLALAAAGFIYAYQHSEEFRDVVDRVVGFLRANQETVAKFVGIIAAVGGAFFAVWKIMSLIFGPLAAAQKIFAALRFVFLALTGPVGLVIAAIALLVGGLIWAYNESETFRDIVDAVFSFIADAAVWLWENAIKPYFGFMIEVWENVAAVLGWLWFDVMGPVFELMVAIVGEVWKRYWKPFLEFLIDGLGKLGGFFRDVYWDYIEPIMDRFGLGADDLADIWARAVDAIGSAWESLKGKLTEPLRFIVETVINKGFVDNFNKLADYFGTSKIPHLSLPFLEKGKSNGSRSLAGGAQQFDTGGYTGPGAKYQPAGIVHADEYVIRKESTNAIRRKYGLNVLDYMNTFGDIPGLAGYSGGGLVALGRRLQGLGFDVSEHPAFGGVNGVHSRTGWHYRGGAIDVNWPNGQRQSAEETARINGILGLAKQYGVRVIWQYPNHYDHIHFDIDSGPDLGNFAGAGQGRDAEMPWWIEKPLGYIKDAVNGLLSKVPDTGIGKLLKGFPNKVLDLAAEKITEMLGLTGDYVSEVDGGGGGSGVARWRDTALAALRYVGQPAGLLNTVLRRMDQESGGNPRAINLWDSNALAGIPSKGLMQVIDPTFRLWRDPDLPNDIWNPMSNLVASMRYAINRYGDLESAYNRPGGYADGGLVGEDGGVPDNGTMLYDNGGYLAPGVTQVVNLTGRPEPVFTARQFDQMQGATAPGSGALIEHLEQTVTGGNPQEAANESAKAMLYAVARIQHGGVYAGRAV